MFLPFCLFLHPILFRNWVRIHEQEGNKSSIDDKLFQRMKPRTEYLNYWRQTHDGYSAIYGCLQLILFNWHCNWWCLTDVKIPHRKPNKKLVWKADILETSDTFQSWLPKCQVPRILNLKVKCGQRARSLIWNWPNPYWANVLRVPIKSCLWRLKIWMSPRGEYSGSTGKTLDRSEKVYLRWGSR